MSVDPEIILNELLVDATPRTQKALNLLNEILNKQSKEEVKDFSIATIGRLSSEAGGVSTQTIRNRTGKHFQQLIEAWATHSGTTTKKPMSIRQKQLMNSNDQQVLDSIDDPVLRSVVGSIIAERNRYRDQLKILKSNTEIVIDKTIESTSSTSSQSIELTPMEEEALRSAIDDDFFKGFNWKVTTTGQVLDWKDEELYKRGYVSGIRKIINS